VKKRHINNGSVNYDLLPMDFYLSQNYPNPFSKKTKIKYCIPYKTKVNISVFNKKGNKIKTIVNKEKEAGTYEVEFNASELLSGEYFYKLITSDFTSFRKTMLVSMVQ